MGSEYQNQIELDRDYEPRFQGFHELMPHRVQDILLVASLYDSFILEEDGQLSERIFSEYHALDLRYALRIKTVSTGEEALKLIEQQRFDLVITMMRIGEMNVTAFTNEIKKIRPSLPVVLLAYDTPELTRQLARIRQSNIDSVFVWQGNTNIFLAIIKQMEDRLNVEHDITAGNVRVIIIVEDSPRYYSAFLPIIYSEIVRQTRSLIAEGLNDMHKLLRMRARPKILLATNFEEAKQLFSKYKKNLLGVITDISFPHRGQLDWEAGFEFVSRIKREIPDLPILLQSSNTKNAKRAKSIGAEFLDKNSRLLLQDLRQFILENWGFGDFIFRIPDGTEVGRAHNLRELQNTLSKIPNSSIEYHASRNHFSNWLMARTEFSLAERIRPKKVSDYQTVNDLRQYLINSIASTRHEKSQGVITDFSNLQFDPDNTFIRLVKGSLGGKARGIAFIELLLTRRRIRKLFPDIQISLPQICVIGTQEFDLFLDTNDLYKICLDEPDNAKIAKAFINGQLSPHLRSELKSLLKYVNYPIAVRSSSLLEDSHFQPFAGLYSTYMLPNNHPSKKVRLEQLSNAIKLVYASVFFQQSKAYMEATNHRIEEEKMAVAIQRIVGNKHGRYFYPNFSGVTQSYNFYPISYFKPSDGISLVALGLGKMVVEGGQSLQFSPKYPRILPQFATIDEALDNSQKEFYALDMASPAVNLDWNSDGPLVRLDLKQAESDGTLAPLGSVYSVQDQRIYDGIFYEGPRLVTFAHILKSKIFPLADILNELLDVGQQGMGCPVEIEFAVNLNQKSRRKPEFAFLQIRPLTTFKNDFSISVSNVNQKNLIGMGSRALGNGEINHITDLVYIKPDHFNSAETPEMARQIGSINAQLKQRKGNFILIGPGRWGSADSKLGIPVTWDQISRVKFIVEHQLDGFYVDPSQGTHFFQNMTAFKIGYFSIQKIDKQNFIDWNWLNQQPAEYETQFLRQIHFKDPLVVRIDGRSRVGIILKPGLVE